MQLAIFRQGRPEKTIENDADPHEEHNTEKLDEYLSLDRGRTKKNWKHNRKYQGEENSREHDPHALAE